MFTIATNSVGNSGLAAVCDKCGAVTLTTREADGKCVLPDGWLRTAHQDAGTVYGIPLVRSTLVCPECVRKI